MIQVSIVWNEVQQLLYHHNCVIVPDFGGFVASIEPSRIDQVTNIITPPSKRIVFNQNLKNNDGLLVNALSIKLSVSYNEAFTSLHQTVQHLKDQLSVKKQLTFENFGQFRLNADANYVFLPDKHFNYLKSSFGLNMLQAYPANARGTKINKVPVFKDRKEVKQVRKRGRFTSNAAIVSYVLLLLLMVNGYIFLIDHKLTDLALLPFSKQQQKDISVQEPQTVESSDQQLTDQAPQNHITETTVSASVIDIESMTNNITQNEHLMPEFNTDESSVNKEIQPVATNYDSQWLLAKMNAIASAMSNVTEENEIAADNNRSMTIDKMKWSSDSIYYIIGGVFCVERNARKYADELTHKGYQPELLLNTGLNCNRVSYAKFPTQKEAVLFLNKIHQTENQSAWILIAKR
jgi:hypothetical protein